MPFRRRSGTFGPLAPARTRLRWLPAQLSLWGNPWATWITTLSNVTLNGGIIEADDGHHTLASPITLNSDSTLQARWNNKDLMVTGAVTGAGGLIVNGAFTGPFAGSAAAGTVILSSNANAWAGTTTINSGYLQIGNGGVSMQLGAANTINFGTAANYPSLIFNTTNNITIGDALNPAQITGAGWIGNSGSSTITLSGNNPLFTGALLPGAAAAALPPKVMPPSG